MTIRKRHIIYFFLALIDVALIFASYRIATWVYLVDYMNGGIVPAEPLPLWGFRGSVLILGFSGALVGLYAIWSVYGAAYLGHLRTVVRRVLLINFVGMTLFAALLFMLRLADADRVPLALFLVILTFVILFKQILTSQLFYLARKGRRETLPVLVIGCGTVARDYANALSESKERAERIIGYLAPEDVARELDIDSICPALVQRLGDFSDLDAVLAKHSVYCIVIALNVDNQDHIRDVVQVANKYGTKLSLVPFYNKLIPRKPEVDAIKDVNLINLRSVPLDYPLKDAIKRFLDIVISLFVIAITSWLMLIVAIGVRLSSPGPILFRQVRTGKNGKPFEMLKFRSMRVADGTVSTFKEDKDVRKTKFGSFVRKFSIDELPQFFNVLKGDMSIIGPRPVVLEETAVFRDVIPLYMLRHQVRPGITGWAQIHGYRGDTEFDEVEKRTELDLWYIQNWTLWLDVRIFVRTLLGGFINNETLK